jgi:hypothetical protein
MCILIISGTWKNEGVCMQLLRYMRDTFLELDTSLNDESVLGNINKSISLHTIGVSKNKYTQCPKTHKEEENMSHVPYASEVGSLMYAMVCTRPDIAHVVGVLRRYMSKPRKEHWTTVKMVFRYLRGTASYGLCYQGRSILDRVLDMHGFVDADWRWIIGDLLVGMCLTCLEEQ